MNPKICVAFNSGAAGDFFISLLTNQMSTTLIDPDIDANGMFRNPPGDTFKHACEQFFLGKFKNNPFNSISTDPVVNTHYCYKEIIDLFPECRFYFIDDSKYVSTTVEIYIKKRLTSETLLEWLHRTNPFLHVKKMNNLTDKQIRTIMINDWNKCLRGWKNLNLTPIDLADIIDKEKCRNLVESIVQSEVNEQKFNQIYDAWASKNIELITSVKYKS